MKTMLVLGLAALAAVAALPEAGAAQLNCKPATATYDVSTAWGSLDTQHAGQVSASPCGASASGGGAVGDELAYAYRV